MSLQAQKQFNTMPQMWEHDVRVLGATSAASIVAPTGRGMTVTYVGSGVLTFTWKENPGTYLGQTYSLSATTMSALAGFTAIFGAYNATAFTIQVTINNSSFAGTDLAALQWLTVAFQFAQIGSNV